MIELILLIDGSVYFFIDDLHIAIIFILFVNGSLELFVDREILNIVACGICVYQCGYTFWSKVQVIVLGSIVRIIKIPLFVNFKIVVLNLLLLIFSFKLLGYKLLVSDLFYFWLVLLDESNFVHRRFCEFVLVSLAYGKVNAQGILHV